MGFSSCKTIQKIEGVCLLCNLDGLALNGPGSCHPGGSFQHAAQFGLLKAHHGIHFTSITAANWAITDLPCI
jgi:hypothetical protein